MEIIHPSPLYHVNAHFTGRGGPRLSTWGLLGKTVKTTMFQKNFSQNQLRTAKFGSWRGRVGGHDRILPQSALDRRNYTCDLYYLPALSVHAASSVVLRRHGLWWRGGEGVGSREKRRVSKFKRMSVSQGVSYKRLLYVTDDRKRFIGTEIINISFF